MKFNYYTSTSHHIIAYHVKSVSSGYVQNHVVNTVHLSRNHQLGSHFLSMLFADSEHLENSIKHLWVEQALQNEHFLFNRPLPPKMASQFMLHDKENEAIRFLL